MAIALSTASSSTLSRIRAPRAISAAACWIQMDRFPRASRRAGSADGRRSCSTRTPTAGVPRTRRSCTRTTARRPDQNLVPGWGKRRNQWQFGLGVQHELLPRLSAEVTYNRAQYGNLTDSDTRQSGCDYFGPRAAIEDYKTCARPSPELTNPSSYDFYTITAPVDPRLPNGGGYVIRGLIEPEARGALPAGSGNVTLIREDLEYAWNGVDTNFVLRARAGCASRAAPARVVRSRHVLHGRRTQT